MEHAKIIKYIFDSWNKPIVFADTDHIIRYLNVPAQKHYKKWGDILGKSIFHCHNEKSVQMIKAAFKELANGKDEVLLVNNEKHRVYMRGVMDEQENLAGYYERFDPPLGK